MAIPRQAGSNPSLTVLGTESTRPLTRSFFPAGTRPSPTPSPDFSSRRDGRPVGSIDSMAATLRDVRQEPVVLVIDFHHAR